MNKRKNKWSGKRMISQEKSSCRVKNTNNEHHHHLQTIILSRHCCVTHLFLSPHHHAPCFNSASKSVSLLRLTRHFIVFSSSFPRPIRHHHHTQNNKRYSTTSYNLHYQQSVEDLNPQNPPNPKPLIPLTLQDVRPALARLPWEQIASAWSRWRSAQRTCRSLLSCCPCPRHCTLWWRRPRRWLPWHRRWDLPCAGSDSGSWTVSRATSVKRIAARGIFNVFCLF